MGFQLDDEVVLDVAGHALGEEGLDAVHVLPVLRILYAEEFFSTYSQILMYVTFSTVIYIFSPVSLTQAT
jgi:hypothetical protein